MTNLDAAQRWLGHHARRVRPQVMRVVLLGVLQSVLLVLQAFLIARIIHGVVMEAAQYPALQQEFLLWLGLLLLRGWVARARERAAFHAGARVREEVRQQLLQHIVALGPAGREGVSTGDLSNTLLERVEALEGYFAHYLPQRYLAGVVPLVILLIVFPVNWAVGLLLLCSAPLVPLFMALVGKRAAVANQRQFQTMGRMSAHFLDRLRGLPTLRLLDRDATERQQVSLVATAFRRRTMQVLRIAFLSSTVLEFFTALAIALSAVYLAMVLLGEISLGVIVPVDLQLTVFLVLLAPEFFSPLRQLGIHYHARAEAVGAAEAIADFLDRPVVLTNPQQGCPAGSIRLDFEQVSLAFDGGQRPALRGVSFSVQAGERVALVGPSGAGKSTVVNLLLGFLQPDHGVIRVNGTPLSTLDLGAWRQQLAWIGQQPMLFQASLRENILLGRTVSPAQLQEVLGLSGVAQFLDTLPRGLDTPLGEQSFGLSGGQAQRVALARALLVPAPLMILDEPTASLDADAERWVLAALAALPQDTTVLLVSHRLASIRAADRIVRLAEGQVLEDTAAAQRKSATHPLGSEA